MGKCKFLLLLTMLFIGLGSFAQTTVEFVAGVDKGSRTSYDRWNNGQDEVTKDGVTMHCNNATFATDKYCMRKAAISNKTLTFTSQKNILSIEFVDVEGLGNLSAGGFEADAATWMGESTAVSFTVKGEVKYSKAIVTIQDKLPVTLAFGQSTVVGYYDFTQTYQAPAVTVKSGDNVLTGLALTYESSDDDVASVDGAGVITPKAVGTTVITAKFAGNDEYEDAEARFTLKVEDGEKTYFHETFDNMNGEGGNDGNFNLTSTSGAINTGLCDNAGWEKGGFMGGFVYNAAQCVRVEMSSDITTPALANLSGDAFLMFSAAQNRPADVNVNLSISGGGELDMNSVPLTQEFDDYIVLVRNATPQTRITFSCSAGACFYLDDVKVERAIVLDENADNSALLEDNQLTSVNVALKRSLSTEYWNTVCLPFDVEADELDEIFGEGTKVKAFDRWDADENTIYFTDATAIEHGMPYLMKPGDTINGLLLDDIVVYNEESFVSSAGTVGMQGTLNPVTIAQGDVFLGTDGLLYNPDTETEGSDRLLGFRAYFRGIADLASAKVNIDGTVSGIDTINGGAQAVAGGKVYSVDGRCVGTSADGLAKGLYIVGGKKIVVK